MRKGQRRVNSRQYRKIRLELTLSADKADRLMADFVKMLPQYTHIYGYQEKNGRKAPNRSRITPF